MIFDEYDRVRIVNLPERKDRRRDTEAELASLPIRHAERIVFVPAKRLNYPGVFKRTGSHGNFLTQLGILESALAAGESVLILEDDCQFFPAIRTYRQPEGTEILWGGWRHASDPADLPNSNIVGSHMMGFSPAVLEKLVPFLRSLLHLDTPIDPAIVRSHFDPRIRPPIDGAYVWFRRYHPEFKTEFAMLADQRPSASDVAERKWFDRVPVVRKLANQARRVKQRLN